MSIAGRVTQRGRVSSMIEVPDYFLHALCELGVREMPGSASNACVLQYWKEAKTATQVNDDSVVPWCAAFVGAMLMRGGVEPTRKANAKSFLTWGHEVKGTGLVGAIVVLNRPPPAPAWTGHVAFCCGMTSTHIHLLGGNQADKVSIAAFPRARVAAIRAPLGIMFKPTGMLLPVSAVEPGVA